MATWAPPSGSWEDHIAAIDAHKDEDGKLMVFLNWKNGKKTKHSTEVVYRRCPQKVSDFEAQSSLIIWGDLFLAMHRCFASTNNMCESSRTRHRRPVHQDRERDRASGTNRRRNQREDTRIRLGGESGDRKACCLFATCLPI